MKQILVASMRNLVMLSLVTGIVYPVLIWSLGMLFFPQQAKGTILEVSGVAVGSLFIGQDFQAPRYFHGRPSATGGSAYDPMASGGSNNAPGNPVQKDSMDARRMRICSQDACGADNPPLELLQASASGLDPEISIAAALFQVKRIALARGLQESHLVDLIQKYAHYSLWGIFGTDRVNVLKLNLALDQIQAKD